MVYYYFFYLYIQSDSLVLQKNTSYLLPNPLATDRVNMEWYRLCISQPI